jgi:hypothetical protein
MNLLPNRIEVPGGVRTVTTAAVSEGEALTVAAAAAVSAAAAAIGMGSGESCDGVWRPREEEWRPLTKNRGS